MPALSQGDCISPLARSARRSPKSVLSHLLPWQIECTSGCKCLSVFSCQCVLVSATCNMFIFFSFTHVFVRLSLPIPHPPSHLSQRPADRPDNCRVSISVVAFFWYWILFDLHLSVTKNEFTLRAFEASVTRTECLSHHELSNRFFTQIKMSKRWSCFRICFTQNLSTEFLNIRLLLKTKSESSIHRSRDAKQRTSCTRS